MKLRIFNILLGLVLVLAVLFVACAPPPSAASVNTSTSGERPIAVYGGYYEVYKLVDGLNGVCYVVIDTYSLSAPAAISCVR